MKKIIFATVVAMTGIAVYADAKTACIQKASADAKAGHKACEGKEKSDKSKCKQEVKSLYAEARKACGRPVKIPDAMPPAVNPSPEKK